VSDTEIISYLRETAPLYIYSNPITVSEASAALRVLEIIDSNSGKELIRYLKETTDYFRTGLVANGWEVIEGEHPVVPLMVRDTKKTVRLVEYLKEHSILATGLSYPVVPRGDEEIRFQICADHTRYDLDYTLQVLEKFKSDMAQD
jgi:glycine C-acetyltransferase